MVTSGGDLNCKHLIHAVGPDHTKFDSPDLAAKQLQATVRQALTKAHELGDVETISMPVVGAGGVHGPGFGKELCADVVLTTCTEWFQEFGKHSKLKNVRVCDFDKSSCLAVEELIVQFHIAPWSKSE